ncbi:MAG: PQQ-binding-like beta-propeller repeat protein [Flavitalea sp.]
MFINLKSSSLSIVALAILISAFSCKKPSYLPAPPNVAPKISTFEFRSADNRDQLSTTLYGKIQNDTIYINVLPSVSKKALVPTVNFEGNSIEPASGKPIDFTAPVTYVVKGAGQSTKIYTVIVNTFSTNKELKKITLAAANNPGLLRDTFAVPVNDTILLYVSPKADLKKLVPTLSFEGARTFPSTGEAIDFTKPVTYTVVAEDGSMRAYTVMATTDLAIIIPNTDNYLYSLDATTGAVRWKFNLFSQPGGVTVADGIAYAGNRGGMLYAIDAYTGNMKWAARALKSNVTIPTVVDNVVYVGVYSSYYGRGQLAAFNKGTGTVLWETETFYGIGGNSSPVISNDTAYMNLTSGQLIAINIKNGAVVWTKSMMASSYGPSPVSEGLMYVTNNFSYMTAYDTRDLSVKWKFDDNRPGNMNGYYPQSTVAVYMQNVYCTGATSYCLDKQTGALKWRYNFSGYDYGSPPVFNDGKVYFISRYLGQYLSGNIHCVDAETGRVIKVGSYYQTSSEAYPQPVISKSTLCIPYGHGLAVLRPGDLESKWHIFGSNIFLDDACILAVDGSVYQTPQAGSYSAIY